MPWCSDERSEEATEDLTFAGISGVFGGLVTFPFAGVVMALETYHERWQGGSARLLPGIVSATAALAILYPLVGSPFLAIYDLGSPDLQVRWILWAIALGALGAALGVLAGIAMGLSGRASRRIGDPVVRAVVAGGVIAAIGFVLPVTLFSGRDELTELLEGGSQVSMGLLAAVFAGKLVAFVLAMRWGFFGGPIFPLIFLGAVAGGAVHALLPAVPLVVAVPALAGAAAVALMPLPLTIMVITTIMFGLGLDLSVIPAVAVVTAFILVRGTGVMERLQQRAA